MSIIYKNQTALRIVLNTGVPITGALSRKIYFKKPDGTTGDVDATASDETAGIIYYDLVATPKMIDQDGDWMFWSGIVFADGREARGKPVKVVVKP